MRVIAISRFCAAFLVMTSVAVAQDWHRVASSFCSQITAKGAKVSGRPFSLFEAPTANSTCCEGLTLRARGKTEDFGHFKILDLDRGRYFLSFDLKTKQVNVPISVEWIFPKRYISSDCAPTYIITVDKNTNQVKWEERILLD